MLSARNLLAAPLPVLFHNAANNSSGRMIPDFPKEKPLIPAPPTVDDLCIVEDVTKRGLICPICQGILKEAVVIYTCGHTYCNECIQAHIKTESRDSSELRCPYCKEPFESDAVVVAKQARESTAHIMVRCIYGVSYDVERRVFAPVEGKCNSVFPLIRQQAHLQQCPFATVVCSFEEDGCEATLPRAQMPAHERECEYRMVDCPCEPFGCKHFGPGAYMPQHLETCVLYPALPTLLGQDQDLRASQARVADLQRQKSRLIEEHRQMESTMAELLGIIEQTRSSMEKQIETERAHAREMKKTMDAMARHVDQVTIRLAERDRANQALQSQLEAERKRRTHLMHSYTAESEKNRVMRAQLQHMHDRMRGGGTESAAPASEGEHMEVQKTRDANKVRDKSPQKETIWERVTSQFSPEENPAEVAPTGKLTKEISLERSSSRGEEDEHGGDTSTAVSLALSSTFGSSKQSDGASSAADSTTESRDSGGEQKSDKSSANGNKSNWIGKNLSRRLFGA